MVATIRNHSLWCCALNDNPFSETCFKTLKYKSQFPKHLGCVEGSRKLVRPVIRGGSADVFRVHK